MHARMRYGLTQRAKVTEFEKRKIETVRRCASGALPPPFTIRGHIVHAKRADNSDNRYFIMVFLRLFQLY